MNMSLKEKTKMNNTKLFELLMILHRPMTVAQESDCCISEKDLIARSDTNTIGTWNKFTLEYINLCYVFLFLG